MPKRAGNRRSVELASLYHCAGCGCSYRYRFSVQLNPDERLDDVVEDERKLLRRVDCPECGRRPVQHYRRHRARIAGFFVFLTAISIAISMYHWHADRLRESAYWVATPVMGGSGLLFLIWATLHRNQPDRWRRRDARRLMSDGKIHSVEPGDQAARQGESGLSAFAGRLMCVLAATLIVTFACLLIPGAAPGYNPEIVPGYAAPGDTVQYRFARRATIDNYWRGKPVAILQHQGAARQPREVRAEASSRDWPETIETKNKDGSGVRPAVDVQIPDDSTLVGQTVELNIEMEIEYPVRSDFEEGKPRYRVEQEHLHASVPVHIVEPGTRDKLFLVWWFSGIVASICLVLPPLLTFLNNNRAMRTSGDAPIEAVETPVDNRQVP